MVVSLDLPPEAHARLEAEATRRGVSLAALIADFAAGLPGDPTASAPGRLALVGAGASAEGITHRIDELLADGFGRD